VVGFVSSFCCLVSHKSFHPSTSSSSTCNAVLEAARKNNCPVIIQVSNGGGAFVCGKAIKDASAAAIGSVALAMHVRSVAKLYGIPVVLHSDHCAKVSNISGDESFVKYVPIKLHVLTICTFILSMFNTDAHNNYYGHQI
jgi:hypothetical protein